jgi:hypothetical protein
MDFGLLDMDQATALLQRSPDERAASAGKGFDRVMVTKGSSYRDQSTIVIMPSRDPKIHYRVANALYGMIAPMNHARMIMFCVGDEVGIAYNSLIRQILDTPELARFRYIMTVEADNLVPPDAQRRLLESIEAGKWDAVSGLYFTKGEINEPMAYGDPARFESTGELEFRPRDVRACIASGGVMPVNGIAMGCALWRTELFREIAGPWFVTVDDLVGGQAIGFTQDLYFCRRARLAGRRFAVDMRVHVGHMDLNTQEVY